MIFRYGDFFVNIDYLYLLIPISLVMLFLLRRNFVKEEQRIFRSKGKKRLTFLLKLIFFALLLISLGNPQIERTIHDANLSTMKILIDKSESMRIYDIEDALARLDQENIPMEIREVDMGSYSDLGNEILNNLEPGKNLLLLTDGQNNFGASLTDVSVFASSIGSRLYALELSETGDDARVWIEGPSKVVSGVDNEYIVKVKEAGNVGNLAVEVLVDGEVQYEGPIDREIKFSRSFNGGSHEITATIEQKSKDMFSTNNQFYKSVQVYDKPDILFVTDRDSPLQELYSPFYRLDVDSLESAKLDDYLAVVLNNIPSEDLEDHVDMLEDYVADGNGLMVVGGKDSYDWGDYNKSQITRVLPVSIGKAKKQQDITNIMILLDTGASGGEVLKEEITHFDIQKSLAADIITYISPTNRVGVIEANYYLHTITGLSELGPKRKRVIGEISLLKPEGFSELRFAFEKAHETLRLSKGSKNIVIITDGKLVPQDQAVTLDLVERARDDGIKTFIISVGEGADEEFLRSVKEAGEGEYFTVDESNRIKLYFGSPEDTEEDLSLFVYDSNHFITEKVNELGKIYGFNNVYPKSTARMLVTTTEGDPVLTIWNYGLGRVASFTSDDGSLWVPELVGPTNSPLLIKTLNWAIGNPERNSDLIVEIPPLREGEASTITVRADQFPKSELNFYEEKSHVYKATYFSNQTGYTRILGRSAAVNYKKEHENLGMNPDLKRVLQISGGDLITYDDNIREKIESTSDVETVQTTHMAWVFILAAILVYLLEIFIRRVYEFNIRR